MSTILTENGRDTTPTKLENTWQERIRAGQSDKRKLEPVWHQNLAFCAGRQWFRWNTVSRRLELPPDLVDRDLYQADIIGEYRMAALGELSQDEDRPQLLTVSDGEFSDDVAQQLNAAVGHGWTHEWGAERAVTEARRNCIDLGTSAIRCRFDPTAGPELQQQMPYRDGAPVTDIDEARSYVAETATNGGTADLRTVHEGRTRWEPLTAFNLIVPPGVALEEDFPWEVVVRPVPVGRVRAEYGDLAAGIDEDTDIGPVSDEQSEASFGSDQEKSKLRDHVWVYTCYEKPTQGFDKGRVIVLVGGNMKVVSVRDELPYQTCDESWHSGIAYFHWERVTGRFWSRGVVEKLRDPQRLINRRRTQAVEIVDRGMPHVFITEGSLPQKPSGRPMEYVEMKKGADKPEYFGGVGAGEWMYRDVEEYRNDAEHAAGIRAVRLGENPTGVDTYAQLAQLNENDQLKRQVIYKEQKRAIGDLIECGVHDMRRYWPEQKQLMIAGDEGRLEAQTFLKSKIPDFYVVEVAKGVSKPRSQAANLALINDIYARSIEAGQPLPLRWYVDSIEAGKPMELPPDPGNVHVEKAQYENHLLADVENLQRFGPPPVDYFDPHEMHVIIHRESQVEAELSGDALAFGAHEQHIQQHLQAAQIAAQRMAEIEAPAVAMEQQQQAEQQPGSKPPSSEGASG